MTEGHAILSSTTADVVGSRDVVAASLFGAVMVSCRRILRRRNVSPLARALARSIHCRALVPYQRHRASVHGNPALCVGDEYSRAMSSWADLAPILHSLITRAVEVLAGGESTELSHTPQSAASIVLSSLAGSLLKLAPSSSAYRTIQSVWADVLSVFAVHLDLWLERGLIFDDFGDFFITPGHPDAERDAPPVQKKAFVVPARLPSFISVGNAEQILRTGCVMHETKCCATPGLTNVDPDGPVRDLKVVPYISKSILEDGRMISLRMDSLCAKCKEWTSQELSRVVSTLEVINVFRDLRGYLLLGYEGVWRSCFALIQNSRHLLHPQMTDTERVAVESFFEKIVSSSVGDHDGGTSDLLQFRLHVGSDGDITASYIIPCPIDYMFPSTGGKYCCIFAIAFIVRHAAHELERCYLSLASAYRSKHVRKDRTRLAQLKRLSLLRMRMSRFVQAYDDYLQMDVFESGFQKMMVVVAKDNESGRSKSMQFDEVLVTHLKALDSCLVHSLASSEPIKRRLEAICKACLQLCDHVGAFLDGSHSSEFQVQQIEADFMKNANLFLRVISSVQSRIGGAQISMLLMRLDFNNLYAEEFLGGSV